MKPTILPILMLAFLPLLVTGEETLADYQPLLENSPFLSKAFKERLAQSESSGSKNLTLNGYTRAGGEWKLCFIKKKDNLAVWAKVGEVVEGFTIKAFAPGTHSVTLEKSGISTTLKMEQPK